MDPSTPEFSEEELANLAEEPVVRPKARRRRITVFFPRRRRPKLGFLIMGAFALLGAASILAYELQYGHKPHSVDQYSEYARHRHWPLANEVRQWGFEILCGLAALLLAIGAYRYNRSYKLARGVKRPPWVIGTLLGIAALTIGGIALLVLLREADKVKPDSRPQTRIEAIKTAATVVVGTSGIGALFLGARRHWTSEADRLDERFRKAVELLESDKGVVRVSGMVALERLAQRNPEFEYGAAQILEYCRSDDPEEEKNVARTILMNRHQYYWKMRRIIEE
jgi:hypothetical protein